MQGGHECDESGEGAPVGSNWGCDWSVIQVPGAVYQLNVLCWQLLQRGESTRCGAREASACDRGGRTVVVGTYRSEPLV